MTSEITTDRLESRPVVSVIVPARNEEASLDRCLRSLVSQQGVSFELIIVNDGSTDYTAQIAGRFSRVKDCPAIPAKPDLVFALAMEAPAAPDGWTGKANAVWTAAKMARGEWLLFTDADTEHLPGSLARAVEEARGRKVDLLSYSPEQEVRGFVERALMPVVFAELAVTFKPSDVSDPASSAAAANGQYLLITREAYDAVGGHAAVAGELLEDVALARLVKRSGRKLYFRFGGDQVRARMYRGWEQLREGWTKNLALLFTNPERLALYRLLEFAAMTLGLLFAWMGFLYGVQWVAIAGAAIAAISIARFVRRIRCAHFDPLSSALAFFGGPIFAYLLISSVEAHREGSVIWKGRMYPGTLSAEVVTKSQSHDSIDKDSKAASARRN